MTDDKEVNPVFDMLSFVVALICGPIVGSIAVALILVPLSGAAGEPVLGLFIPVGAVVFGALPYLVFGTPVFLSMVKREPPDVWTYALGGVIAEMLFGLCLILAGMLPESFNFETESFFAFWLWGVPFSAIWGGAFGGLYRFFLTSRSARRTGSEGGQS